MGIEINIYCIFDRISTSALISLSKSFLNLISIVRLGVFRLHGFRSILDGRVHYALTLGKISNKSPTLVRVQTANVLTDALGMTSESKSTNMIKRSLAMISDNGSELSFIWSQKKRF